MATTAELAASIASLISTLGKAFEIVNGPATGAGSTVVVESGTLPTFAAALAGLTSQHYLNPTNGLYYTVSVAGATGNEYLVLTQVS